MLKYDEVFNSICRHVYDGFINSYSAWLERDEITKDQLHQVYIHVCKQVYDTDFTNALASRFSCSAEDVYVKHSDVLAELKNSLDHNGGNKRVEACVAYAETSSIPLKSCVRMYLRYHNDWSQEDKQKTIERYKSYIDTTDLETEFLS